MKYQINIISSLVIITFFILMAGKTFAGTIYSTLISFLLSLLLIINLIACLNIKIGLNKKTIIFGAYLFLFCLSIIRQFLKTEISFFAVVNVLIFLFSMLSSLALVLNQSPLIERLKLLAKTLNIFILLNFLMYFLGLHSDRNLGKNMILEIIGITTERILFFLTPSLAYSAMICGVSFILNYFLFKKTNKTRYLLFIIIAFCGLILTDSRGPILGLFLITLIYFFFEKIWIKYQFFFLVSYFFSTTIFISAIHLIDVYLLDVEKLSRKNSTLLSNREEIWKIFFTEYKPSVIEFFFGYGNLGQYISGISPYYKHLFLDRINPEEISLHNNYIQMLIDVGLVGIVLFFMVCYLIINECFKLYTASKDKSYLIIPILLNYLFILGFSDIVSNISNVGIYFILLFLIIASINLKEYNKNEVFCSDVSIS